MWIKKINNMVWALAFVSALAGNGAAWAGNWSSGGGDAVVLPDDTVVLADPLVEHVGEPARLAPELVEELLRIGKLVDAYGGYPNDRAAEEVGFLQANVLNPMTEYRLVDELPAADECQSVIESHWLAAPEGGQTLPLACTVGPITWFKKSLFEKMTVREQAKAIVHERMHGQADLPHEIIADITKSLEVALGLMNAQMGGATPALTPSEVAALELLRRRVLQAGLVEQAIPDFLETFQVVSNGGAIVAKTDLARVDASAYLGIGVLAAGVQVIGPEAKIIGSGRACLNRACSLGKAASLSRVSLSDQRWVELGEGASISSSKIASRLVVMGAGSSVAESSFYGTSLYLDENARLEGSDVVLSGSKGVIDILWNGWSLRIAEGASLVGLKDARFRFDAVDVGVNSWIGFFTLGLGTLPGLVREAAYGGKFVLKIPRGTEINAGGETLCAKTGKNRFHDKVGYRATIGSLKELIRRCDRK